MARITKCKYPPKCTPEGVTQSDVVALQRLLPWCVGTWQWLVYRQGDGILPYTLDDISEIAGQSRAFTDRMIRLKMIYRAMDFYEDGGPVYAVNSDYIRFIHNAMDDQAAIAEAERIISEGQP